MALTALGPDLGSSLCEGQQLVPTKKYNNGYIISVHTRKSYQA